MRNPVSHHLLKVVAIVMVTTMLFTACSPDETLAGQQFDDILDHPLLGFSSDDYEEYLAERQQLVEDQIEICMRERGFDYERETLTVSVAPVAVGDFVAHAQDFGFGIAWSQLEVIAVPISGPSQEISGTDSREELEAYQRELTGYTDVEAQEQQPQPTPESCRGTALRNLVEPDNRMIEAVQGEFAVINERVRAEPRFVELTASWGDCMRLRGYDYRDKDQAIEVFLERTNALAADYDVADPSEHLEFEANLIVLYDEEVAVAVAAAECELGQVDEIAEIYQEQNAIYLETEAERLRSIVDAARN